MEFLKTDIHRRFNPLLDEWVLVSPHRTLRPWKGQMETVQKNELPAYEPDCYLCPGNKRAGGEINPQYTSVYVFQNDFSALLPNNNNKTVQDGFMKSRTVSGECRVLCYSPKHNVTLSMMDETEILKVIEIWKNQTIELKKKYKYVQVFENKGAAMGCSNPHPHGQIWAGDFLPNFPEREYKCQENYFKTHGHSLLKKYAEFESGEGSRTVLQNENWLVVVPFWAGWPFETMLLPLFEAQDFSDINTAQSKDLSAILKNMLTLYDNLFKTSFPFSMGWHQSPTGEKSKSFLLHAHFYPPLLRSAEIKKFMVGYELLAEPQRDILPETAAEMLRSLPRKHYLAP